MYLNWEEEGSTGPEPVEGKIQCASMHLEGDSDAGADVDVSIKFNKCVSQDACDQTI